MLEEREVRLAASRRALKEGDRGGADVPFDVDVFLAGRAAERTA